jgi:hypothetical protein
MWVGGVGGWREGGREVNKKGVPQDVFSCHGTGSGAHPEILATPMPLPPRTGLTATAAVCQPSVSCSHSSSQPEAHWVASSWLVGWLVDWL